MHFVNFKHYYYAIKIDYREENPVVAPRFI